MGIYGRRTCISIHALLAESDHSRRSRKQHHPHFYPRSPCGERPECRVTDYSSYGISIHALLAESDSIMILDEYQKEDFYPRSPCGERQPHHGNPRRLVEFLSTLSLRRATDVIAVMTDAQSISIHALLAESDEHLLIINDTSIISIHALLAESDILQISAIFSGSAFLSTLSLRRATGPADQERLNTSKFLSTLSLRRATAKVHKTVGHFCAYETNFMGIASSC